jgi:hypothetical protein
MPTLTWDERNDLAQQFSPRLVLFPEQQNLGRPGLDAKITGDYHPRTVELLLTRGTIQSGFLQSPRPATLDRLAACKSESDQLLIRGKHLPSRNDAWRTYFDLLNTGAPQFPLTTYARVQTRAEANARAAELTNEKIARGEIGRPFFTDARDDDLAIQYWFCYFYDDWANQHEGDWEGICIFLRHDEKKYRAVGASYYAHETGKRRHWAEVERESDDHPRVFVAAGSHASYFQYVDGGYLTTVPGFIIPFIAIRLNVNFSTNKFDRVPNHRDYKPLEPRVELLPDPIEPPGKNDPAFEHQKWLAFRGSWGVKFLGKLGHAGPTGPSHKGLKWHNPFVWMERHCTPDFLVY